VGWRRSHTCASVDHQKRRISTAKQIISSS